MDEGESKDSELVTVLRSKKEKANQIQIEKNREYSEMLLLLHAMTQSFKRNGWSDEAVCNNASYFLEASIDTKYRPSWDDALNNSRQADKNLEIAIVLTSMKIPNNLIHMIIEYFH